MSLSPAQREQLDSLDDLTGQTFVSTQYAGMLLHWFRTWKAEGWDVDTDAITKWGRERELGERVTGMLAGLALAVEHDDDPEAQAR